MWLLNNETAHGDPADLDGYHNSKYLLVTAEVFIDLMQNRASLRWLSAYLEFCINVPSTCPHEGLKKKVETKGHHIFRVVE